MVVIAKESSDAIRKYTAAARAAARKYAANADRPLAPRGQPVRTLTAQPGAVSAAALEPVVMYHPAKGVDDFVRNVSLATPMQLVEVERHGVAGQFLKDVAKRLDMSAVRVFDMLGVPKATVEKKSSAGEVIAGSGGQAAIGIARLIGLAQDIVAHSTAKEAKGFDAAKWLGQWLERPQPSLGGRKPAELMDTPTGVGVVAKLLGAIESGAYQ